MELTIAYKNGFIKTILVDGLYIYGKKLIYRKDNKQLDVELAYLEYFRLNWEGGCND